MSTASSLRAAALLGYSATAAKALALLGYVDQLEPAAQQKSTDVFSGHTRLRIRPRRRPEDEALPAWLKDRPKLQPLSALSSDLPNAPPPFAPTRQAVRQRHVAKHKQERELLALL